MSKTTKIALLLAAVLVVMGTVLLLWAMFGLRWDFHALSTVEYETKTHILSQDFDRIAIYTDTTDIRILLAEDGQGKLVITQQEKQDHRVSVEDGALTIAMEDTRQWYDHITLFSFGESGMTLYLTETDYEALLVELSTGDVSIQEEMYFGNVNIATTTGDIRLDCLTADEVNLSVNTGDITANSVTCHGDVLVAVSTGRTQLRGVWCENLISTGSTGDITVEDGTAKTISITRSTGDVRFKDAEAGEIRVNTDTGDVTGTLRSDKIFVTQTDTGDVRVPKSTSGGLCQITTDTGDIHLEIS